MTLNWQNMLETVPAAILGLTIHEYSHALAAYKLGDTTARDQGRLTLNPLKHIDPLGLLLIVVAGFGWAKPVVFDSSRLKHKNRDEILIALAGPFSNLLLGFVLVGIARLLFCFPWFSTTEAGFFITMLFIMWGIINFGLFVFNLIPIPPLDGSHLYMTYISDVSPELMNRLYQIGTIALFAIIIIEDMANITIIPTNRIVSRITDLCISLFHFN